MNRDRGEAADRAVRKVAQLRALFRRLPHVPTPAELRLLRQFEDVCSGPAVRCPPAAIRAGFAAAWRVGEYGKIVAVGRKLRPDDLQADATALATFENALRQLDR